MTNPVLPARFNLGDYLGEKMSKGLAGHVQEGYESKVLQTALDDLDPESTPMERMQKMMSLPISKEAKQMGMKYFEQMQKNQPTLAGSSKALASIAQQNQIAKMHLDDMQPHELQNLLQDVTRNGGDLNAAFTSLEKSIQAKRGGPPERQMFSQDGKEPSAERPFAGKEWEDPANKKSSFNRLKLAFMRTKTGKLLWQNDPEQLDKMSKEDPEAYNDWISNNLGSVALDLPLYGVAMRLLGPIAGMATIDSLAEASDRARAMVAKKKKGGEITAKDYEDAANSIIKEGGKGAIWGTVAKFAPLAAIAKKIPGGEKLLENTIARGAVRIAESGLVGPEAASVLTEGKPQKSEDRIRNLLLALGFEAPGLLGGRTSKQSGEKPPDLGWQGGGEGSPFKTTGLQMGPQQGPPPKTVQEMVGGVQSGQEALQMRTQAQKAEAAASLKLQPQQAAAPQPLQEPIAPESMPAQPLQSGSMQNAAAMSELQGRVKPISPEMGGKMPRPQAQPEMDMLAREQRMGQMRGEKPFIPEGEVPVKPGEMTETMQGRVGKGEQLQKEIGKLRDQVRELNALEHERSITPEANRTTLDNQITQLKDQINVQKKLARKLQKEIQTGRESLADEKIEEALSRRRAKMIEEASAEKAKTDKEVAKAQLKKKAVEEKVKEAKKLLKQAEKMPGDYSDSFIRVKQRYVDEFSRVRDIAKKEMDMSDVGSQEYRVAQRMHDEASAIVKEAQADLTLHKAKKSAEHAAETAKKEAQIKAREKTGQKVEKLTPKKFNEFKKTLKEHAEKPTKETTEKLAEQIGVKPEVVKETTQSAQAEGKKFADRIIKPLKVQKKAPKVEPPKAEAPKGEATKAKEGSLTEALEQTKEGSQPKTKQSHFKKLSDEAKNLVVNLSKGQLKQAWDNQLGRNLVIQSAIAGISEVLKEYEVAGFSGTSIISVFAGNKQGIPARAAASFIVSNMRGLIKLLHKKSLINRYNEYSRQGKYKEAMALKLTPKQIKEAKEKRYK